MINKVRVYGKAQNRTVLGIANAYLVLNPNATLEELNKAFPASLTTANRGKVFIDVKTESQKFKKEKISNDTSTHYEMMFFSKEDELLVLSNGQKVAMQLLWTKPDFEKVVKHAEQYEIEVAEFTPKDGSFKKGGYRLEYINGYVPGVAPKKTKWWLWVLILILVLAIVALLVRQCGVQQQEVVAPIVIIDTVFVEKVEAIEKNFNTAQFEQAKSELSNESKLVLNELVMLMQNNSDLKLQIVGHTSDEGEAMYNQKLSETRAKSAVDYLIECGVDANRLSFEGKGSSVPLDPDNREVNRRVEFIVKS